MGTSSARKAPVGKFWRPAKTAISRFASGKEASPPRVQEVVARYLTALKSDAGDDNERVKNFLPAIVGTAASLGNFYRHWEQDGWEAALASASINPSDAPNREDIIPALLDQLVGPGNKLEEAVARAALIDHLEPILLEVFPPTKESSDPSHIISKVSHFLGLALYRKLLSDLGEPLEFHAPNQSMGSQRQAEIRSHILAGTPVLEPAETREVYLSPNQVRKILDQIVTLLGQSA